MIDAIVRALWRMFVSQPAPARVGDRRRGRAAARARTSRAFAARDAARVAASRRCCSCPRALAHPSRLVADRRRRWLAVAARARRRVVRSSQPLPPRAVPSRRRATRHVHAPRRAQDVALLRDVRRRPRTTGSRPTTTRRTRRARSRTAPRRRTWACSCSRTSPRTTWATSTVGDLVERVSRTLATMAGLERFRGHFYNWYDTRTLAAAAARLRLHRRLRQPRRAPARAARRAARGLRAPAARRRRLLDGLADTVRLALEDAAGRARAHSAAERGVDGAARRARGARCGASTLEEPPRDLGEWRVAARRALAARAEPLRRAACRGARADGRRPAAALRRRRSTSPPRRARATATTSTTLAPWARAARRDARRRCARRAPADASRRCSTFVPSPRRPRRGARRARSPRSTRSPPTRPATTTRSARRRRVGRDGARRASATAAPARVAAARAAAPARATSRARCGSTPTSRMLYDEQPRALLDRLQHRRGPPRQLATTTCSPRECRLASFLAIAKGDVPQEHWFRLGRAAHAHRRRLRAARRGAPSMFEYLMPLLVMRDWPETLLDETYRRGRRRGRSSTARQRGVPWGVSESAFNAQGRRAHLPVPGVRRARASA